MLGQLRHAYTLTTIVLVAVCIASCADSSTVGARGILDELHGAYQQLDHKLNACPCLYVANHGLNAQGFSAVNVYSATANFNTAPLSFISGPDTGMNGPAGLALDRSGNVYVANYSGSTVTVYQAGASGDASPIRTISGPDTGLSDPDGIAFDSEGELIVGNYDNTTNVGSLTVYARGANGDAKPVRTISGSKTNLNDEPGGNYAVTVSNGLVYVANGDDNAIEVFPKDGNGNIPPLFEITGSNTMLADPSGVAVGAHGRLYVSNNNYPNPDGSVTVYRSGSRWNANPIQRIYGPKTGLNSPYGIALGLGDIYVSNNFNTTNSGSITVFPLGATGNVSPIRQIIGSNTGLSWPIGMVVR